MPDNVPKRENVIHDLSVAFLLFAIALFIASGTKLALCFNRDPVVKMIKRLNDDGDGNGDGDEGGGKILSAMLWVFFRIGVLSVIVQVLPVAAFVFLAKVVEFFDYRVGVITFWFMIAFIILEGSIWMVQTVKALWKGGKRLI